MKHVVALTSLMLSITAAPLLVADEYRVVPLEESAPADALSSEIAAQLASSGLRVLQGESRTVCDLWLAKQWEVKAGFSPSFTVLYPFNMGQLIGVARFKNKGADFRDQEIPAGVYTMRYAMQPVDGNHIGTSDTRDFLLLIPADKDTKTSAIPADQLFPHSAKTSGGTHPAMLSLLYTESKPDALPAMFHDEEREWWSVGFAGTARAGEKSSPLAVRLVVVGRAPE